MLKRMSTPSGLAVSLADLKEALRITHDDDDNLLENHIRGQTKRYEEFTGRMMLPIELEYRTDCWREPITLPAYPVRDVSAVVWLDENHVEQTLAEGDWYYVTTSLGAEVWFTDSFDWPILSDRPQSVRVRFDAGYDDPASTGAGADPETTPEAVDAGLIEFMVGRIYDSGQPITDDELRSKAGHRRIFR